MPHVSNILQNREKRDYHKRAWQASFGFRKIHRHYEAHELLGNVALFIKADKAKNVVLVTHNLYRVEVIELAAEDFYTMFLPDFLLTPLASANELRQCYTNMMVATPPAPTMVQEIIQKPPKFEDFTMPYQSTAKESIKARAMAKACADFNRHTCLELFRDEANVHYIPLSIEDGLDIAVAERSEFDGRYKPIENYPADKAAKLYAEYALHVGATREAMQYLAKLCPILEKEIEMATTKKAAVAAKKATTAATTKANAKVKAPAKKPVAAKTPAKKAAPTSKSPAQKVVRDSSEKKESAAQLFQDLIMEGKLTDDKIFAKVQAKYGLDEKKRGYVRWYRNHLAKQGMNPPDEVA